MKRVIKKIKKEQAIDAGKFLAGVFAGFSFFFLSSHPARSPVRKLPEKKVRNISYFPNIKVHKEDEHYHIHHWTILSLLYPLIFLKKEFKKSKILHGFFIGSIIQGLTYKDRFQVRYKPER